MAIEKQININVDVKAGNTEAELNKISTATEKVGDKSAETNSTLDKMTGGAITRFKGLLTGLKGIALGFKSIGFAIAASGIGLIVITIAALTAAFKGSEEGQNKFAKIMGVIGALVGNLVDVLADLGDFIIDLFSGNGDAMKSLKSFGKAITDVLFLPIKSVITIVKTLGKVMGALFSGDVSGAFDALNQGVEDITGNFNDAKNAITGAADALKGFVKQNITEAKAAARVADDRAKADRIERDLIIDKAKAENAIAKLRLIAKQQNKFSAKERMAALIEAGEIQDELIARETEVLQLRADAISLENTFARSNKENLTAEAEAIAAVVRAETGRINFKRQLARELTAAENEQAAAAKAISNAAKKELELEEKAAIKKAELETKTEETRLESILKIRESFILKNQDLEDVTELEKIARREERALAELEVLKATEAQKAEVIKFFAQQVETEKQLLRDKDEDKADKEADDRKTLDENVANAKINIALNVSALIGQLVEQDSALGKGVAVAQATISGFRGVQAAFTTASESPISIGFPAYPFIQAGLAGAFSAVQIKNILSVNPKTGAGASAGGSGGGGGGAVAPSFNLVEGTGSNQIAEGLQRQDKPIKAFVVSSDVSTSQSLDRNIVENSAL